LARPPAIAGGSTGQKTSSRSAARRSRDDPTVGRPVKRPARGQQLGDPEMLRRSVDRPNIRGLPGSWPHPHSSLRGRCQERSRRGAV